MDNTVYNTAWTIQNFEKNLSIISSIILPGSHARLYDISICHCSRVWRAGHDGAKTNWTTDKKRKHLSWANSDKMALEVNVSSDTLDDGGFHHSTTSPQENCESLGVTTSPIQVTMVLIHVFTLLIALTGNILLIVAFTRMKEKITIFIANMAASDLLVGVFLIPRSITREITRSNAYLVHGLGGLILCKISTFLSDVSLSVSTQNLILISGERFLAVVYPFLYKKITMRTRYVLIVSTWILAMALHSPYFYTFRLITREKPNGTETVFCWQSWEPAFSNGSAQLQYNIFLYVTVLFVPLFAVSTLYLTTVVKLRRIDKMVTGLSEKRARRKFDRNKSLNRMVTATLTAFLTCWTLSAVLNFLRLFSPESVPKCSETFEIIEYISRVLASSYCAVNPCICFMFLKVFSRELSIMCKRNHQRDTNERELRRYRKRLSTSTFRSSTNISQ